MISRAVVVAAVVSFVLGGCDGGNGTTCGGDGCATASCTPGATACSEDSTSVSICSESGSSVRQKTCIPPARCGSIGQQQYDCVTPDAAGGLDANAGAADAEGVADDTADAETSDAANADDAARVDAEGTDAADADAS